jgi:threonine dehydrogenase-like Zn-dependent dehydrogenase
MRALVLAEHWSLEVQERPTPPVGPGDVRLDVIATGICGSDLHGYTGENGRRHAGQVMGHETVAVVAGDDRGDLQPGTVVTVNPVLGCLVCPSCRSGEPQRCPQRRVIGVDPAIVSAFADQLVAPARNVVPLPPGVKPQHGALVEPLAVGYHAVRRGRVTPHDRVLVLGGGPIGQAVVLGAQRLGAPPVVVSEPDAHRRGTVSRLGAHGIDPTSGGLDRVADLLGGPPTLVVDAVGLTPTLATALEASAPGARIVLVGMGAPEVTLAAYAVSTAEREVIGSFCYSDRDFRDTAAWLPDAGEQLALLVDDVVALDAAPATFAALARGEVLASKVLVAFRAADWSSA